MGDWELGGGYGSIGGGGGGKRGGGRDCVEEKQGHVDILLCRKGLRSDEVDNKIISAVADCLKDNGSFVIINTN